MWVAQVKVTQRADLIAASVLARNLLALSRLLRFQLGRQIRAEIFGVEDSAYLDLFLALFERRTADPLDGLVHRFHLPEPEAGNQFLGLGEGSI
jgi:hypothetical protein